MCPVMRSGDKLLPFWRRGQKSHVGWDFCPGFVWLEGSKNTWEGIVFPGLVRQGHNDFKLIFLCCPQQKGYIDNIQEGNVIFQMVVRSLFNIISVILAPNTDNRTFYSYNFTLLNDNFYTVFFTSCTSWHRWWHRLERGPYETVFERNL